MKLRRIDTSFPVESLTTKYLENSGKLKERFLKTF